MRKYGMTNRQLYRDISIVLLAKIDADICNPLNLFKNNIINNEELASIDEKMRVNSQNVSFKTSEFELLCDGNRLQLRSENSMMSGRLGEILSNLIRIDNLNVDAIGINATSQVFFDAQDYRKLCRHIYPDNAFLPMAGDAMLLDLSFVDWNNPGNELSPRSIYRITRLPNNAEGLGVLQISVNNHLAIKGNKDLSAQYLSQANALHAGFFNKSKEFLNGIQ